MIRRNANNIRSWVECVFRHQKKLIVFNLLVILLVTLVVLYFPRTYRSEAKIWLKIGRENSKLDPSAATGETISVQETDREDEIESVVDIIGSRGVATGTVEKLGPQVVLGDEPLPGSVAEPKKASAFATAVTGFLESAVNAIKQIDPISEKEEAIQAIVKYIEVDSTRKSNVISISYDADSPELAQAIVQALIEQYSLEHARIHTTEGSLGFFAGQRRELEYKVLSAAEELRLAKDQIGLLSIDGQRKNLETQMLRVRSARLDAIRNLAEAEARSREINKMLVDHPKTIQSEERLIPNSGRDLIRSQLYALQVRRMELESKLSKDNPLVVSVKAQEDAAQKELAAQTTTERKEVTQSINKIHEQLTLDLTQIEANASGYRAMLETLNKQEQDLLSDTADINLAHIEIKRLERELELAEANFMTYAEYFEDARIDKELNESSISNISVAQLPTFQEEPIRPSKLIVGLLGIAAMLFGSIAIVTGIHILDDSIHGPEDLEEVLHVPVMASVPNQRRYSQVLR